MYHIFKAIVSFWIYEKIRLINRGQCLGGWTASFRLELFFDFFAEVILVEEILVRVLWLRGGINIILHGLTSNEGPELCLLG